MIEKDLISIIIPVYNAENYIARCLDTVINQTYKNLQIIIINDGSTDKSGDICREYAQKDNRIEYYYQANAGQAVARNKALDQMTGDYVAFVDADDYVSYDFVEMLYSELKKNSAQIAICDYLRTNRLDEKITICNTLNKINVITGKELLYWFVDQDPVMTDVLWNKLFCGDLFQDIRFPEGKIYEDFLVCDKLLMETSRVVYIEKKMYFYFINPKSTTKKSWSLKSMDILEQLEKRAEFYSDLKEIKLYDRTIFDIEVYLLAFYYYFCHEELISRERGLQFVREYRAKYKLIKNSNSLLFLKKMFLFFGYCCPYICGMLSNEILKRRYNS